MTAQALPYASPWLSAWRRPRLTIAAVVAREPGRMVWLLASLGLIANAVIQLLLGDWNALFTDWRFLVVLAAFCAVFGAAGLYACGQIFRSSGRLFGGVAPPSHIRAALAWGQLPILAGVSLYIVVSVVLQLAGLDASAVAVLDILLALVIVVAQFWALVVTCMMLSRVQNFGFWRTVGSSVLGLLLVWILLTLLVLPFRTLVLQPFNIPSSSMTPTLQIGDYLFVSKYAYGYSRYSVPFSLPLFSGRILSREPQRGDVVVFRLPKDQRVDYISRIVGLPGDRIQMIGGHLHINGDPVKRERIDDFPLRQDDGLTLSVKRWRETLPSGVSHETLDLQEVGFLDNTPIFVVPAGQYFMMGDNRDNATDSRVPSRVGFVPFENLVGRAAFIYVSGVPDLRTGKIRAGFRRFGRIH